MGLFDNGILGLNDLQQQAAASAKRRPNMGGTPQQGGMFQHPGMTPEAGVSPTQIPGQSTAQVFSPLIQHMAGITHQAVGNRQTMGGNGMGLSTPQAWNGMFSQGAKDLSPQQLRASQGSTAMNQWADPQHFQGSMPSAQSPQDAAAMASPGMFHISDASRALTGQSREPTTRDLVPPDNTTNPFANSRAESPTAASTPAPASTQGPSSFSFATPPHPMFSFGSQSNQLGQTGANTTATHSASNPPTSMPRPNPTDAPTMFGPPSPGIMNYFGQQPHGVGGANINVPDAIDTFKKYKQGNPDGINIPDLINAYKNRSR